MARHALERAANATGGAADAVAEAAEKMKNTLS